MIEINPQEVYDIIEDMPIEKLTTANAYKYRNCFCFAGWIWKELTGEKITRNLIETNKDFLKFTQDDLIEELTMIHIEKIVMPLEDKQIIDKQEIKQSVLNQIKEHIK